MSDRTTNHGLDPMVMQHSDGTAAARDGASPARTRGARPWIVLTIVIVLVAGGVFLWRRSVAADAARASASAATPRALPVVTATARKGDLPLHLDELGTVTALNTVTIRSRVDGQLLKVAFTEGQLVHEGDLLAELDPRPFEVQLAQAEGQRAKDDALLKNAQLDLKRYEEAREAVPRQQIDTAAANVAQFEGAVRVDQSAIDNARLQLVYCKIASPLTGKIGLRLVDQGNMVHANDANGLALITQVQPITVQFSLPQDALPRVQQARAAGPLVAEAWNRDLTTRLETGTLAAVDNQIDMVTGTVRLKAVFDNASGALFPNQFVNVRLLVETKHDAVLIPQAAVQRSPQSMFVYVVGADDTVSVRVVKLGASEGDTMMITEGLAAGERVVTDGVDKLQDGTKVVARPSGAPSGARSPSEAIQSGAKASGEKSAKPSSKSDAKKD